MSLPSHLKVPDVHHLIVVCEASVGGEVLRLLLDQSEVAEILVAPRVECRDLRSGTALRVKLRY